MTEQPKVAERSERRDRIEAIALVTALLVIASILVVIAWTQQ